MSILPRSERLLIGTVCQDLLMSYYVKNILLIITHYSTNESLACYFVTFIFFITFYFDLSRMTSKTGLTSRRPSTCWPTTRPPFRPDRPIRTPSRWSTLSSAPSWESSFLASKTSLVSSFSLGKSLI